MFNPLFVPPRNSPALLAFTSAALPSLIHLIAGIRSVRISPEDFHHLEALRYNRAILAPNHPTGHDPLVVMWLSRMLNQPFNYLCAREVLVGPKGWLLNQLGTYSVIRGVPDRESLKMTRTLLAEYSRKVVIFPEGEIYEHNDTLLSFQSGIAQIGFWTLDDLVKHQQEPNLPVLPIAIKYRTAEVARTAIERSLTALETALSLGSKTGLSSYQRLLRIGDKVLGSLEQDLGVQAEPGAGLPQRVATCRLAMLRRVAKSVGTDLDNRLPAQDQLHQLFNQLRSWVGLLPPDHSDYDERLYRRKMEIAAPIFRDLYRLQNFIAVTGDYIAAEATAERFLEVLNRLEVEVFGEVRNKVSREALVRIAKPIRLEERYDDYKRNRRDTVAAVTRELETTIRQLLRSMARYSTPISLHA